ncbi:MAG: PAS domain S-box protein [Chloroflexota bacterium]
MWLRSLLDLITEAIITIDANQSIVFTNHGAVKSFRYSAQQLQGQSLDMLLSPSSTTMIRERIQSFARNAVPGTSELLEDTVGECWRRSDGKTFPAHVTLVKLNGEEPMSVTLLVHDNSDRQRVKADLQQVEAQYRSLVDSVQDYAIFMLDPGGLITSWNTGAERITGYHTEEIIGNHFRCFFPDEAVQHNKPESELQIATTQGRYVDEVWQVRKDGSSFWAHVVLTVVHDEYGQLRGFSKVIHDITEQRQVEAALRHYTARLNVLYEISQAILTAQSPEAIAEASVRRIRHLVPCQYVSMVTYDDDTDTIHALAVEHETAPQNDAHQLVLPTSTYDLTLLRDGQIHYMPDVQQAIAPDHISYDWQTTGLRSYLSAPLLAHGKLIGVLTLAANAPGAFGQDVLDVVRQVADQLAVALQNARLFAAVHTGREQLQGLSHRLIEAQESERRAIAGELHDEIGQALTLVKMNLQVVQETQDNISGDSLSESIGIVEQALQQVRDLSLDLRPSLLDDLGLIAALRWYGARQARLAGISFHFTGQVPEERLPTMLETTCFRVAQEALTNVVRHAHAQQVWMHVQAQDTILHLTIRDDGVGFDPHTAQTRAQYGNSFGLLGMRERVAIAGGKLHITSAEGEGTTVMANFPLHTTEGRTTR